MRGLFFNAWESSDETLFVTLKKLLDEMQASGMLTGTRLAGGGEIYDNYWNDAIYREIPSRRVADLLRDRN
jgi:hypothetical protein